MINTGVFRDMYFCGNGSLGRSGARTLLSGTTAAELP